MSIITKTAKIFEAKYYADRDLTIEESVLDKIVANFKGANVKIEHLSTALDNHFGFLCDVWKTGKELFGTLKFPDHVWKLLEEANAKRLSVGLTEAFDNISEISVVKFPALSDARIFTNKDLVVFSSTEDVEFTELSKQSINYKIEDVLYDKLGVWAWVADTFDNHVVAAIDGKFYSYNYEVDGSNVLIYGGEEVLKDWKPNDSSTKDDSKLIEKENFSDMSEIEKRFAALEAQIVNLTTELAAERSKNANLTEFHTKTTTQVVIDRFKEQGKIIPANEDLAFAILKSGSSTIVKFKENSESITNLFVQFLEQSPKIVNFSEEVDVDRKNTNGNGEFSGVDLKGISPEKVKFTMKGTDMTPEEAVENILAVDAGEVRVEFDD